MNEIPISVRKLKLTVPLRPADLAAVPLDGPIGDLTVRLTLEGAGFEVAARVNGKSYRRMYKTVIEKGAENVMVIFQGDMVKGAAGSVVLDSAGFQVIVKAPRPTED